MSLKNLNIYRNSLKNEHVCPIRVPFRYKGDYQYQQTDDQPHEYYDPNIETTMLNDIIASRIPNYSTDITTGKKYDYLTNYKYNIVKNHELYNQRGKIQRSWWD